MSDTIKALDIAWGKHMDEYIESHPEYKAELIKENNQKYQIKRIYVSCLMASLMACLIQASILKASYLSWFFIDLFLLLVMMGTMEIKSRGRL